MASVNQSRRVMASVSEQLLADLDTDKLKRFKWRLKNYYSVSATDLEKADAPDTVDLMIKRFGPEVVVKITMDILRKMNQNHVAEELEKKHKQAQAESIIEDPAPAGAKLKPIKGKN
ncbi:caspase a-like [Cyprinus carpio]|uniref:Caspase a-like n=1 Tax=Cyprinus carpio TaxID=7962 RepID=A0A9Q9VYH9_CYPCA|nr:caspase a-like [Cyprinus carpio]